MKKSIIALGMSLFTLAFVAQKKELRAAEKAIKKENFSEAEKSLSAAEGMMSGMKEKEKAQYYFLKAQVLANKKDYKAAADTFNKLFSYEKEIGKDKYTDEAKPMLNNLVNEVSTKAVTAYNDDKNYKEASEKFYLTYLLSPKDTAFLFNAAIASSQIKDFDTALKYLKQLKQMNYIGAKVQYLATNKETGQEENLGSKSQRDLMVKAGQYTNPEDRVTESKRADIIKNIGYILVQQGKTDEAMVAINEARKEDPKDLNLILTEADLYIKIDRMDKFAELMKEAIALDPNNPTLYFNLGVINANEGNTEEAIKYYKKAIELKPNYADAYTNLAIAILSKEKAIVDEMNKSLSDFDKYDKLLLEQKALYKKALPYLEKSDELKEDIQTVQTLLNIYSVLEMGDKAKKYQAKYDKLRGK